LRLQHFFLDGGRIAAEYVNQYGPPGQKATGLGAASPRGRPDGEDSAMLDQVMDTFRKATESTLNLQQQMLQQWTQQWSSMPGLGTASPNGAATEQLQSLYKQVTSTVTDLLKKHREALDAQYAAGIRTIEEAFRVGEAKDPVQFLKLTEEFWKHSFECLRTLSEEQVKGVQAATQKWLETVSKGVPTGGK
jgi:hypothetical protein